MPNSVSVTAYQAPARDPEREDADEPTEEQQFFAWDLPKDEEVLRKNCAEFDVDKGAIKYLQCSHLRGGAAKCTSPTCYVLCYGGSAGSNAENHAPSKTWGGRMTGGVVQDNRMMCADAYMWLVEGYMDPVEEKRVADENAKEALERETEREKRRMEREKRRKNDM